MLLEKLQPGFASSIVSQIDLGGARFQVIDYRWNAGAETFSCEPENMLRWRIRPHRIEALAWSGACEQQSIGQMTLQTAGVPMCGRLLDDINGVRSLEFRFDRDWLRDVTGSSGSVDEEWLQPCLDLRNSDIDHAMRRLMQEILQPGLGTLRLAEGLAVSIAVDLARYFEPRDKFSGDDRHKFSARRVQQIRDFVENYSEGCPSLKDIAQLCGVSTAHLRKFYKSTTGETLTEFIEKVRLKRAKALVAETGIPLKIVSYKLGFSHPSAFSYVFKKMTGESPSEYREKYGRLPLALA